MSKFKFGGFETEIDAADYDFTTRYEQCCLRTDEKCKAIGKDGMASEYILAYCRIVFDFFNELFGEGTAGKMFGDKTNLRVCDNALVAIAETMKADVSDLASESKANLSKITGNRQQRRRSSKQA